MFEITAFTLSCSDPGKLAEFYRQALDAKIIYSSEESAYIATPNGIRMGFDRVQDFTPPHWSGDRQPSARIDLAVADLAEAERRLLSLGATRPGTKADTDKWIFLADPEGHPFCVTTAF